MKAVLLLLSLLVAASIFFVTSASVSISVLPAESAVKSLVANLRHRYQLIERRPGSPGLLGGGQVQLSSEAWISRDLAYRDDPNFVNAAAHLLASADPDDAMLGAWLLKSVPAPGRKQAAAALKQGLGRKEPLVRFYSILSAVQLGVAGSVLAPSLAGSQDPSVRAAALWATVGEVPPFGDSFLRGVSWRWNELGSDEGKSSFQYLKRLGVNSVAIICDYTPDAQHDDPNMQLGEVSRRIEELLPRVVKQAHTQGISVIIKPQLWLDPSWFRPTQAERQQLRSMASQAERRAYWEKLRRVRAPKTWHGAIAMKNDQDWEVWFSNYVRYVSGWARLAEKCRAEMLCLGNELDSTALQREQDWREVIAAVRKLFYGKLVYGAFHETFDKVRFWDALDAIGISAYFPVPKDSPSLSEIEKAWEGPIRRITALSQRFQKPVIFTEIGYSSSSAAGRVDLELQARYYQAATNWIERIPAVTGVYWWDWKSPRPAPFRDRTYTPKEKPASMIMARWFLGMGSVRASNLIGRYLE